jgi:peptidoglycan/LPS O-acetylase OafA/YrhL
VYIYITNVFLSFALALLVFLIVEQPFKNLERVLWTKLLDDV